MRETVKHVIIFHHPGPVSADARSGSQVRPWRLLQAFETLGYSVEPVVGYGAERRRSMRRILDDQTQGRRFAFVYSEARSIPTLLTEPHRLPRFPLLDFRFLRAMRAAGIPVGLFYRDVFWRFGMYRNMLPWLGRAIAIPLYWYDWWWYRRIIDHLFLPSQGMAQYLPTPWPVARLTALPPGAQLSDAVRGKPSDRLVQQPLRMLYVGGIRPPSYDLRPLLEVVRQLSDIRLTLCCRRIEWESMKSYYASLLTERIEIVHVSGDALTDLYARADVFGLLWKPYEYLDFAVPVKIFEAIGHGLPIITLKGTEAARFIEAEDIGWAVADIREAQTLLASLCDEREKITNASDRVLAIRQQHTWEARAQMAASCLTALKAKMESRET